MFSQTFAILPDDIRNQHLIPRLDIETLYALRLVNKEMLLFVSNTLAGGFVKKAAEQMPSLGIRWVSRYKFGGIFFHASCSAHPSKQASFSKHFYTRGFGYRVLTSLAVGSSFCLLSKELFSDKNFSASFSKVPILLLNSFMILGMGSYAACLCKTYFKSSWFLPDEAIVHVASLVSPHMIGEQLRSADSSFNRSVRNSILADLGKSKLYGIDMIKAIEAFPITAWTG